VLYVGEDLLSDASPNLPVYTLGVPKPVPRGDKLCNPVPGPVLGKASQKSLVQGTTSNMR